MDAGNPAGDLLHILERYRQMKDEELLLLARESSGLTDWALQVLKSEMLSRGLEFEPEAPEPTPQHLGVPATASSADEPEVDPYAEDRQLVELCKVWSLRDAYQLQSLLDRAGIPFLMGPEKATEVNAVTSNFATGVSVQLMRAGWYWAQQVMAKYEPFDEPPPEPDEKQWTEIPVRCPKCQSTEVVFEDLSSAPSNPDARFQWTCDTCGHQWEDDGIVKE